MFEKVRQVLAKEIGIEEQEITLDSNLNMDLGIGSMDLYCLMESLESELQIKIPEDNTIITVEDIVNVVNNQTGTI